MVQCCHRLRLFVKRRSPKYASPDPNKDSDSDCDDSFEPPVCIILNRAANGASAVIEEAKTLPQGACTIIFLSRESGLVDELADLLVRQPNVRFLAGGGDGTLSAVSSILARAAFVAQVAEPLLAPLPLGTGNEAARVLGWGAFHSGRLVQRLANIRCGTPSRLDCWKWESTTECSTESPKTLTFLCFFSMGFDAAISHNFTLTRERLPGLCSSRLFNKAVYAWHGAKELVTSPRYLGKDSIALTVNGESLVIPPALNTCQIFNIHSSGDGIDFWGSGKESTRAELQRHERPNVADGLLEVVGTKGVWDLLVTKLGLRHSHRLAQCAHIQIKTTISIPCQVDGETWIQEPGRIEVKYSHSIPIVLGPGTTLNCARDLLAPCKER